MPTRKTETPISQRFSANLRKLIQLTDGVTATARDLEISRAQFNRYLAGESYPKPAVLKRICDHFGVDARILTTELPDAYLAMLPPPGTARMPQLLNFGLENAVHSLPISPNHYVTPKALPDGLYLFWRHSMSREGQFVCTPVQVQTLPGARIFRSFIQRIPELMTEQLSKQERELRGIILGVKDGYAWLFLHSPVWNNVALVFASHPTHELSAFMPGYYALARDEAPGQNRLARCAMERLPAKRASIVRAAHMTRFFTTAELPRGVRHLIDAPMH
ncbi:helix-turn-helix domain-containing protein [Thetidibacter halocola]|uniref:Helix-turn-helix transcriptional regulator n=1 Tax=Thetidibacter halocola TaxID=2827239 RepID=A0A8J8B8H7_9RHOB|nr:helix-turn-helix transcriptional regulator [Thetidibacter halocola]MBS0126211.1 helix-turn-helix transcriptional regulator [Thetidibacter halocola]